MKRHEINKQKRLNSSSNDRTLVMVLVSPVQILGDVSRPSDSD